MWYISVCADDRGGLMYVVLVCVCLCVLRGWMGAWGDGGME